MKVNLDENKTFCIAPWVHTYTGPVGERRLCCIYDKEILEPNQKLDDFWNGDVYKDIRKKMLSGELIEGCERCPTSGKSYRTYWNETYEYLLDDILDKTSHDGHFDGLPITVDYRTSKCNFKCKMCSQFFSTPIYQEMKKNKRLSDDDVEYFENTWELHDEIVKNELDFLIENRVLQEMYWAGGEPLISDLHWETLNKLIETDQAKDIKLRYTTNLSIIKYKGYDLAEIFKKFKSVELFVSIDGTSHIGEWIRTGFKWDKFQKNFEYIIQNTVKEKDSLILQISASTPTIFDLPNLNEFAEKYNLPIVIQKVVGTNPLLMFDKFPYEVIEDILDRVKKKLQSQNFKNSQNLINFLNQSYNKGIDDYGLLLEIDKSLDEMSYLEKYRPHSLITFKDMIKKEPKLYKFIYGNEI